MNFEYSIETLKIELYRLKHLYRIVEENMHIARTNFPEINEIHANITDLENALDILKRENRNEKTSK